ncbi:MAG TPA: glycerophosphodiester phosphodiesterase [Actinomycetota bacterium]|nr:glycerophosphodiester phosphodiesterase [Actinomycetota bacterium]
MAIRPFSPDDFPTIVAHRGASASHPENTLPAFEAAVSLGARMVELDARLTSDGVAVVLHDPDVSRTTDGEGSVHEMRAEQVAALGAGTADVPAGVPTLRDALRTLSGRAAVAIEIKNLPGEPAYEPAHESIVRAAVEDLEATGFDGPVLVVSFNPHSIAAAKALAPQVATGFLTTQILDQREALAHVTEWGHDVLLPGSRSLIPLGQTFVAEAHDAGVRVGTWTIDDAATVRMLLGWGVDAIASNDPAMAVAELAAFAG